MRYPITIHDALSVNTLGHFWSHLSGLALVVDGDEAVLVEALGGPLVPGGHGAEAGEDVRVALAAHGGARARHENLVAPEHGAAALRTPHRNTQQHTTHHLSLEGRSLRGLYCSRGQEILSCFCNYPRLESGESCA
eukprot:5720394-Pyramimonas_sp.AAC.2